MVETVAATVDAFRTFHVCPRGEESARARHESKDCVRMIVEDAKCVDGIDYETPSKCIETFRSIEQ